MKTLIIAAALTLSFAGVAAAQTPKVEAAKPFGLAATHDGINTDNYTLDITPSGGGASVLSQTKPVSALAAGDITFSALTAPARGTYNAVICATNTDGLSSCSDPFLFQTTKGQPNKPGKPRIVSGLLAVLEQPAKLLAKLFGGGKKSGFGEIRIITEG